MARMMQLNVGEEFPVTRRWAFLDHAAVAPMTARARRALHEWTDDLTENGVVNEPHWLKRVEQVRGWAAQLLNADPGETAFIKNTSEGIGFVAEGYPWRPGDNVVIAAEEYPANVYPWMNLAGRGVETRFVPSRGARVAVDDLISRLDAATRVVSLSFVEFSSGFRNDLDAIGALCRERGILFCVDAIQGLGVLPLDVRRAPVDFLAADGHKWLLGPEGAGLFWARPEALDRLRPVGVGWNSVVGSWHFSTIDFRLKPNAGRYESGTLNVGGVVALGASIELLLSVGIAEIERRVVELTEYVCERGLSAGLEVFSSRADGERSGIVSLVVPGGDVKELVRRGRAEGVVVSARAGRLRVSPHFYNTRADIDRLFLTVTSGAT